MNTVNAPENIEKPEPEVSGASPAADKFAESPATDASEPSDPAEPAGVADAAEPTDATDSEALDRSADTSIYVRRGRVPALGFWIVLAIAVPAVLALISSPFFGFADLGGVVNFVLLAAVFVGLPLAAIAAAIDAYMQRSSAKRGHRSRP